MIDKYIMSAEILALKSTSAELVRRTKVHHHQVESKVTITPGILGFPQAVHEITVIKGTRKRTLKAIGFTTKP